MYGFLTSSHARCSGSDILQLNLSLFYFCYALVQLFSLLKTSNLLFQVDNSYTIMSFLEKTGRTASFIPKLKLTYKRGKALQYSEHLLLKGFPFTLQFHDFFIKNLSAELYLSMATRPIIPTIHTVMINFRKLVGLHSWTNDWWTPVNQSGSSKKKVPPAKTNSIHALQEGTRLSKKWCNAGSECIYLLKNHNGCFICGTQLFTTCPVKKFPSADQHKKYY